MEKRKIKVQGQHTSARTYPHQAATTTAKLTLSGQWLQEAGFAPGTPTEVEVKNGQIIITAVKPGTSAPSADHDDQPRHRKPNRRAPWYAERHELSQFSH